MHIYVLYQQDMLMQLQKENRNHCTVGITLPHILRVLCPQYIRHNYVQQKLYGFPSYELRVDARSIQLINWVKSLAYSKLILFLAILCIKTHKHVKMVCRTNKKKSASGSHAKKGSNLIKEMIYEF